MAHSFQVLVARRSLPALADLTPILRRARLPLSFPETWAWTGDAGWLPMRWRNAESGCEVELDRLSKRAAAAAQVAGYSGLDSVVTITTRGWESLQAGASFGAALAVACGGCITESNDEYVGPDRAMRWARTCVRDAARRSDEAEGDGDLAAALAGLAGAQVTRILRMMNQLGVAFAGGRRISGSAWRVVGRDGIRHAQDRYADLRARQLKATASPSEQELQRAEAFDAQGAMAAATEIARWPATPTVTAATLTADLLTVAFDCGTSIELVGSVYAAVTVVVPPRTYSVGD